MTRIAHCLAFLLMTAGPGVSAAPGTFEKGMTALMRGDYAIAYCHWAPLADQGFSEAQYHLGWLYANGNGLAVDMQQALNWWLKAAHQDHTDAQFAVALAFTTGEGMQKDFDQAIKWYLSAARLGHEDAREILLELAADPELRLLEQQPGLADESWFGWEARVARDRINARSGPGVEYPVVLKLERGTPVRIITRRGDWSRVVLAEGNTRQHAWIFHRLLKTATGPDSG